MISQLDRSPESKSLIRDRVITEARTPAEAVGLPVACPGKIITPIRRKAGSDKEPPFRDQSAAPLVGLPLADSDR